MAQCTTVVSACPPGGSSAPRTRRRGVKQPARRTRGSPLPTDGRPRRVAQAVPDGGRMEAPMQRPISKTRRGGRVPSARPRLAWRLLLLALALAGAASLAPVAPVAAQEPEPPGEGHSPAWARARDGVQVAATAHFDVWAPGDDQALAATAARVAATAEAVLPTVEARLATPLADRVRLVLLPADQAPGPCEPRAATFPTRRRIVVFVGPATLDPKALPAFLAHELGHQLTLDRWGALGNDRRLSEGVATWAAEPYWLAWRGWSSMDQAAADLLAKSAIAPLAEPHEGCLV